MRPFYERFGAIGVTIILTTTSIFVSITAVILSRLIASRPITPTDLLMSFLIPLALALPLTYMGSKTVSELIDAQNELTRLASIDSLTGVSNRSHFIQLAEEALADASPVETVGLVVIDIDRFKLINDTYGHLVGDEALKMIVRTINLHISQDAIFGRFGGDEFILLSPNTSRDELETLCQLTIEHIHTLSVGIQEVRTRLSVTMGATTAVPSAVTLNDMIARADAALLQAKRQGGGRLRYI